MCSVFSNLQLKSNLYPLRNGVYAPYADSNFVQQILDAVKLDKIYKFLPYPMLTKKQEKIMEKSKVCVEAKPYLHCETSQYFVFSKNGEDTCKCQIKECRLFSICRPKQEDIVDKEIYEFSKFNSAYEIDTSTYYPVQYNFERIIERYGEFQAFELLANTDLKKYISTKQSSVNFAKVNPRWDNWDGGSLDNYYNGEEADDQIYVRVADKSEDTENIMFRYQREHLDRYPFVKKNSI